MKIHNFISRSFFTLIVASTAMLASCSPKSGAPGSDSAAAGMPSVERGKYMVTVMGCNDCHTPMKMGQNGPEPDMTHMLSGHPAHMLIGGPAMLIQPWEWAGAMTNTAYCGPWGISYAANLTPDSATGIGAWSLAVFDSAIRTGKHMGNGRPILPPMPWQWFKSLTEDDLASIYQYLHSIPAISNQVPDPVIPGTRAPMGMGGPIPPDMVPPLPHGGPQPMIPPPPPPPLPPHPIKRK